MEFNLKEFLKTTKTRIRIVDDESSVDRFFYSKSNIVNISKTIIKDKERMRTILLHELGHIYYNHQVGYLYEEIEADNFSIYHGGKISFLRESILDVSDEYYGEYIDEVWKRRFILGVKSIIKLKESE